MNPIATDNPPLMLWQKVAIAMLGAAALVLIYDALTRHYVKQNVAMGRYPLQRKGS